MRSCACEYVGGREPMGMGMKMEEGAEGKWLENRRHKPWNVDEACKYKQVQYIKTNIATSCIEKKTRVSICSQRISGQCKRDMREWG